MGKYLTKKRAVAKPAKVKQQGVWASAELSTAPLARTQDSRRQGDAG